LLSELSQHFIVVPCKLGENPNEKLKIQYGLPQLSATDSKTLVIVGVTRNFDWCVEKMLYPIPFDKAYQNSQIFQADYIVVHNNKDARLMHINRDKIAIKSKDEMREIDYPEPTKDNYMLLALTTQGKLINTPVTLEKLGAKMKQGVFVVELKEICK
jgi:hypothetical protein